MIQIHQCDRIGGTRQKISSTASLLGFDDFGGSSALETLQRSCILCVFGQSIRLFLFIQPTLFFFLLLLLPCFFSFFIFFLSFSFFHLKHDLLKKLGLFVNFNKRKHVVDLVIKPLASDKLCN